MNDETTPDRHVFQPHAVRRGEAPLVIFIDNGFAGFEQMACALRRMGVRVAAVAYGWTDKQTRVRLHLTYGRVRFAETPDQLQRHLREWTHDGVADVICSEGLICAVHDAAVGAEYPGEVVERLAWRRGWADKLAASRRFAAAGIPVPAVVPVSSPEDGAAVDGLAGMEWPRVVKAGLGAGGDGVRVAFEPTEYGEAVRELAQLDGSLFVEQFIEGRNICYCVAYDPEHVYQEGVYVSQRLDDSSTAPSRALESIHHEAALRLGRAVLGVIGGRGLANIEMIEDHQGRLFVIDLNTRPWGSIELLRGSGTAFDEGYLAALGLGPAPRRTVMADGFHADVFPIASVDRIPLGHRLAARHYASTLPTQLRTVGPRYAAAASLDMGARLVRSVLTQAAPSRVRQRHLSHA